MAIGRITGQMLFPNLERQGQNLAIDANLTYFDVNNRRVGVNTITPLYELDVHGNAHVGNLYLVANTITSDTGKINLGSIANVVITGGSANYIIYTDGNGNLTFGDLDALPEAAAINANIVAANAAIVTANTAVTNYVNALNSAMSANIASANNAIAGANAAIVTANTAVTNYVNALNSSMTANVTAANAAIALLQTANNIVLGSNTASALVSNAVTLTTTTKVTDAIAELNYVLGKLVPPSPPNFPNGTSISVTTTNSGLMCNFTQTDNSGWGNLSVTGGTLVNTVRASSFSTSGSAVTNVGPGNNGTVTAYVNGNPNGNVTLTGSNTNTTNGNLYVYNVEDYHAVVSTVTAGFWYVFSTYATATGGILPGWNRVSIYDSATGTSTNNATWYYDSSSPSAPVFSGTSMALSSNVVTYSSTIPMFTSSAGFTLKGNVQNISGDTYPNSTNLFSTTGSGGAFAAPAQVSYATAGVTTPITRNNTAVISFTTTSNVISGFGIGAYNQGPSVTVNNNYNSTGWAFSPPVTTGILYKTGTSNQIEETSITNSYTGGSAAYRIVNPDAGTAADNPSYTGSESAFNSTTGPFYITDATNVAAKIQFDQTNYSTGYLPVGPNLSGHSSTQYFTFKFVKSAVSKFNISYSGTIAGLWVALPGSTIDTTASPTNGWINMASAYAGSGVPGSGTGGNGSAGCSTGGAAVLNSLVSGGSYTCTFGTASSTNSTGNEIYVRVKLTSGQSLTALSIANPTN